MVDAKRREKMLTLPFAKMAINCKMAIDFAQIDPVLHTGNQLLRH